MMAYTNADLHHKTAELQALANHTPILIADGDTKQVLMSYEQYQELAGELDEVPNDAHQFLLAMMAGLSKKEQELLANSDIEFDMSFVGA